MTEIDSTFDPFVEAEVNEHHAALIRQWLDWNYHLCYVDGGGTALLIRADSVCCLVVGHRDNLPAARIGR
jgi:hypothetical protein